MAVYRCRFCGSIYDEEKEGVPVSDLKVCPVCMVTADKLVKAEDGGAGAKAPDREKEKPVKKDGTREACQDCGGSTGEAAAYDPEYARTQTDARYPRDGGERQEHHRGHGDPDAHAGLG